MSNLYKTLQEKPFLMAGTCVIESLDICRQVAEECVKIAEKHDITYIFKASFDKANRTSVTSFRGAGLDEGLKVLDTIKKEFNVPVVTDIHESYQAQPVAEVCDVLQIPAFLCRQTDLLVEAGKTDKIVNIKKAQFLSADDMLYPVEKVRSTGNEQVLLTERGTMFGYNNLVVDFRNLIDMQKFGVPVVMDVTHSTQRPGGLGGKSGGNPEYAPYMAMCASVCGVRGYFIETHPDPIKALSDGPNMVKLSELDNLITKVIKHFD